MRYSLECKLLGTECEDTITDAEPQKFIIDVFAHLEKKHRAFLLDFYKKSGLSEAHRLIADRADREN